MPDIVPSGWRGSPRVHARAACHAAFFLKNSENPLLLFFFLDANLGVLCEFTQKNTRVDLAGNRASTSMTRVSIRRIRALAARFAVTRRYSHREPRALSA